VDNYKITKAVYASNAENIELWLAEARFGFSHLKEFIPSLRSNSDILEVGCGSGILLSMLAEEYSEYNFVGIEPFSSGFSSLKELNAIVRKLGVSLYIERYEEHQSKYDLIYCVNVFEHVEDWRHLIDWASNNLKEDGRFLVLCPNYGFPYESHFKIPIIYNKVLTYKVFKRYILNFEKNNKCYGLWDSLNFVKKREIMKFCKDNTEKNGLNISDDISVIDDMIERLSKDVEFSKRQSLIGKIANLMKAVGVIKLIKKFKNHIPYMKICFRKTSKF